MWRDAGPAAGPRRLPTGTSRTGCELRTRSPVRGGWAGHAARVRTMSTPRRILHVRNGRTRSFELHVGLHRASLLVRRDLTGTAELLPYPARNIGSRWNEPFREGVPDRLPARHGRHRILPDSRPLEPYPRVRICAVTDAEGAAQTGIATSSTKTSSDIAWSMSTRGNRSGCATMADPGARASRPQWTGGPGTPTSRTSPSRRRTAHLRWVGPRGSAPRDA